MNPPNLNHPVHSIGWTDKDRADLERAKTFKDLAAVALAILMRANGPFHMVSGPIST